MVRIEYARCLAGCLCGPRIGGGYFTWIFFVNIYSAINFSGQHREFANVLFNQWDCDWWLFSWIRIHGSLCHGVDNRKCYRDCRRDWFAWYDLLRAEWPCPELGRSVQPSIKWYTQRNNADKPGMCTTRPANHSAGRSLGWSWSIIHTHLDLRIGCPGYTQCRGPHWEASW